MLDIGLRDTSRYLRTSQSKHVPELENINRTVHCLIGPQKDPQVVHMCCGDEFAVWCEGNAGDDILNAKPPDHAASRNICSKIAAIRGKLKQNSKNPRCIRTPDTDSCVHGGGNNPTSIRRPGQVVDSPVVANENTNHPLCVHIDDVNPEVACGTSKQIIFAMEGQVNDCVTKLDGPQQLTSGERPNLHGRVHGTRHHVTIDGIRGNPANAALVRSRSIAIAEPMEPRLHVEPVHFAVRESNEAKIAALRHADSRDRCGVVIQAKLVFTKRLLVEAPRASGVKTLVASQNVVPLELLQVFSCKVGDDR
eukprot:m.223758 g.223758  ORF g.223758 m.223758 type:complete len:308 (-) comp54188_c0_seq9:1194-2117(-)